MRHIEGTYCWIGHAGDAANLRRIFELRIEAVLQLAAEEPAVQTPRELISLRFPILDGAGNDPLMLGMAIQAVKQLVSAEIPTMISCSGGMSRSPAILAAAIALHERCSLSESLMRVIASGPAEVSPGLWNDVASLNLGYGP